MADDTEEVIDLLDGKKVFVGHTTEAVESPKKTIRMIKKVMGEVEEKELHPHR